jgi:hypothetical protein
MSASREKFATVTKLVIDHLEGGYWNPVYHGVPAGYENSGETMFGIDRVAGGDLNTTAAGKKFWSLIDANKSPQVWKWNYIPPEPLRSELKDLAADIIYPRYEQYSNRYLNPKTKEIVNKDGRLIFHFSYATWNGPGWFKKFANDLNAKVDAGVTNADELAKAAIDSRTKEGLTKGTPPNSLIAQGGRKIEALSSQLKDLVSKGIKKVRQNPITTALITSALVISVYILFTQIKKNKS